MVQFGCYAMIEPIVKRSLPHLDRPLQAFVIGGVAGLVAGVTVYPLDTLRLRFAAQGEPRSYRTITMAIREMMQYGGIQTFYKGLLPSLLAVGPTSGLVFAYYDVLKTTMAWLTTSRLFVATPSQVSYFRWDWDKLAAGAGAGALSKLSMMPLDTMKKRLQIQGFEAARSSFGRLQAYTGMLDCWRHVMRQEGLFGFFKGSTAAVSKTAATTAITLWAYESCMQQFNCHVSK